MFLITIMSHISRTKDGVAILVTKSPLANVNTPRVVKADCFSYGMVGQRVALICSVQVRFYFFYFNSISLALKYA